MGYRVSSIFSIAPSDRHVFFVYFLPATLYKFSDLQWINDYFEDNFEKLASSFGKNDSVIVMPTQHRVEEYIEEVVGISSGGCLFSQYSIFPKDNFEINDPSMYLHNGEPYLIVSSHPLAEENKSENSGLVVNLHMVKDVRMLGSIVDAIINGIRENCIDTIVEKLPDWDRSYEKNMLSEYTSMLELKPNVFGLGINLNAVLDRIASRFIDKHNKKSQK